MLSGLRALACGLIVVAAAVPTAAPASAAGLIERVSVASGGGETNSTSVTGAITGDSRYVVFQSVASNVVPGDTNAQSDIFVHDRETGATERVSVATGGAEANDQSFAPSISADGRYVAFMSFASNLVPADTNTSFDVFVRDRQSRTTEALSLAPGGTPGNGDSKFPSISADGRYVAFQSEASNLVGNDTNDQGDVFVHDRQSATVERVSVAVAGGPADGFSGYPAITPDGRFVSFTSSAGNLVAAETNVAVDVFVHDRQSGTTEQVSVSSGGEHGNYDSLGSAMSADARYVAFQSHATNLVVGDSNVNPDIFVRDRQSGTTERVSVATGGVQADGHSFGPAITADGNQVAFSSPATNLVAADTNGTFDVFVHDRETDTTERVSAPADGGEANGASIQAAISADGSHVAFSSVATNLVPGDTNAVQDVFVRERTGDANPPVLSLPGTITINADRPAGRTVTYAATAVDDVDGSVSVGCSPPSGTTFPIGTTIVSCSAADAAGNVARGSFAVVVKSAAEQLADLSTIVRAINLKQGIANSLDAKLQDVRDALSSMNGGNSMAACNKLDAALNEIRAQSGKDITVAQAADLIADINRVKLVIGCP
jgi:Tol biopolymer transport system component